MSVFDAVKYGWSVNWCLLIEGIPIAFVDHATGLSLPSGWTTESATLALDDGELGSEIDRLRGVGCGLDLSFRLMDSTALVALMQQPTYVAQLTADIDGSTLAALTVDDQSAWPIQGWLYCGLERMDYDHKDGTTAFHALTRGVCSDFGGWPHRPGSASSFVTNTPKIWRGRDVRLYAVPVDPAGYPSGTTLLGEAQMVWRGRIDAGPRRVPGGFGFAAVALDRLLDRPYAGSISGTVADELRRWLVDPEHWVDIRIDRYETSQVTPADTVTMLFQPFGILSAGTYYSAQELQTAFSSAWLTVVSASSEAAYIGELEWHKGPAKDMVQPRFQLLDLGTSVQAWVRITIPGSPNPSLQAWGDTTNEDSAWLNLAPVMLLSNFGGDLQKWFGGACTASSVTVTVDEGAPSDVPSAGLVKIGEALRWYESSSVDGSQVVLGKLHDSANPNFADLVDPDPAAPQAGQSVEFLLCSTQGANPATLMLEGLESSGDSGLRGTDDTLSRGQGYSIDHDLIDEDNVSGAMSDLAGASGTVSMAGASWADLFGGLLALRQQAMVCRWRPDLSSVRLCIVPTGPHTSDWKVSITDADLLALEDEPVTIEQRADPPNRVIVERQTALEEEPDRYISTDLEALDSVGCVEQSWSVPIAATAGFADLVKARSASWFASDMLAQAITLRVGPWVDVHPGDSVKLTLTHPTLWTWSTGEKGYTGTGRCIKRTIHPSTLVVTLTVLIDAQVLGGCLSPSALITGHTNGGGGGAIDSVDIAEVYGDGGSYYDHFSTALAQAGASIKCLTYKAGEAEDDLNNYVTVSAITSSPGDATLTLTVSGWTGEAIVNGTSRLTLPKLTGAVAITDYQAGFAHDGDGTFWI